MTDKVIDNAPIKAGGLRGPDPVESQIRDMRSCPWRPRLGSSPGAGYIREPGRLCDQFGTQSCGGQGVASAVDQHITGPDWCSGRSLWLDALRREGIPPDLNSGTYLTLVIESLVARGWDPYHEGEDALPLPATWRESESLADEMTAADHRQLTSLRRSRITETGQARVLAVATALADPRLEVVVGGGTREPYLHYRGDESKPSPVLGTDYRGGSSDGHATHLLGHYYDQTRGEYVFVEKGSWGVNWGGCRLPDGRWFHGCCLISADVIAAMWDAHVLELQ